MTLGFIKSDLMKMSFSERSLRIIERGVVKPKKEFTNGGTQHSDWRAILLKKVQCGRNKLDWCFSCWVLTLEITLLFIALDAFMICTIIATIYSYNDSVQILWPGRMSYTLNKFNAQFVEGSLLLACTFGGVTYVRKTVKATVVGHMNDPY